MYSVPKREMMLYFQISICNHIIQGFVPENEKPPGNRILEEGHLVKLRACPWKVGDDNAKHQAQVLSDEVITRLSNVKERKQPKSLAESPSLSFHFAFCPDQINVSNTCLDPALRPSQPLFPESAHTCW